MSSALRCGRGLLLDRDGIINLDHGYVGTQERFEFRPGIKATLRLAHDRGFRLIIVTNQSGIARGYYSEADFRHLTGWMCGDLAAHGIPLTDVLYCPFHRVSTGGVYDRDSYWRKPNPGMMLEAAARWHLDLTRSVMLGDQPSDMAAAAAAQVGLRVLLWEKDTAPPSAAHHVIDRLEALPPLWSGGVA